MYSTFLHDLPVFTSAQFFMTWGVSVFVARILFDSYDRWVRSMPWIALWLVMTPLRPLEEDIIWMIACFACTEMAYFTSLVLIEFAKEVRRQRKNGTE